MSKILDLDMIDNELSDYENGADYYDDDFDEPDYEDYEDDEEEDEDDEDDDEDDDNEVDSLTFTNPKAQKNNENTQTKDKQTDVNQSSEDMFSNISSTNYPNKQNEKKSKQPDVLIIDNNATKPSVVTNNRKNEEEKTENNETKHTSSSEKQTVNNNGPAPHPEQKTTPKSEVNEEKKEQTINNETYTQNDYDEADTETLNYSYVDDEEIDETLFIKSKKIKKPKTAYVKGNSIILSDNIKKGILSVIIFVATFFIVVGLPLLLSKDKPENKPLKKEDKTTESKLTTTEEITMQSTAPNYITTENPTTQADTSNQNSAFDEASQNAYNSVDGGTGSSRFASLEDLTLYIEGTLMTSLSAEKQAVTAYENNAITYEELCTVIEENTKIADEINHLLIANKNVYINAGQEDKYNELLENNNTLIIYGDTALYNAVK